jgi:hypothetical protein
MVIKTREKITRTNNNNNNNSKASNKHKTTQTNELCYYLSPDSGKLRNPLREKQYGWRKRS